MARIDMQTARTAVEAPEAAAEDLVRQLTGKNPKLVTMFASRNRDQEALNKAVRARLPKGTRLVGATTAGEIDASGHYDGQVVLGALSGDFEVGLGLGKNLYKDAIGAGASAIEQAARDLGTTPADLDPRKHVGVVIDDGFKFKKEELLLGALEANPDIVLVGGGAASPDQDPANGEVCDDATLVALFRTSAPFAAMRSHWYEPTGRTMTLTKIDETLTRALEIDGKPAALRYAELLDVGVDELEFGKPRGFALMPTASRVGKEYFLRSAWKPLPDNSIQFVNLLEEGSKLELMKLGDPVESTRRFFTEEIPARIARPTASMLFHCGARTAFARATGQLEALAATFKQAPTPVGFSVYFEIYCGFHINTTLTTLVFGEG
jgi:hypothetical protein